VILTVQAPFDSSKPALGLERREATVPADSAQPVQFCGPCSTSISYHGAPRSCSVRHLRGSRITARPSRGAVFAALVSVSSHWLRRERLDGFPFESQLACKWAVRDCRFEHCEAGDLVLVLVLEVLGLGVDAPLSFGDLRSELADLGYPVGDDDGCCLDCGLVHL
jgi:hypothetical protein